MKNSEFGPFRSFLWPIHRHEMKKLIPIFLIFFLLSLNYNMLRSLKDTLVVTAQDSGAEMIPFIEVWMMLPMSIGMTWLYSYLASRYSREKVFYIIVSIFLVFFFLFIFFLYPNREQIYLYRLADSMQNALPNSLYGLISMIRYWIFSLFYVMCELWANIVLLMLFWGFANEVSKIEEAKRFYGLFGAGANLSGIVAGYLSIHLCGNSWEHAIQTLTCIVLMSGILALLLFYWLTRFILRTHSHENPTIDSFKTNPKRPNLSLKQSFVCLFTSPYLVRIAILVLSYYVVINLVEILWKHELKALHPSPLEYNAYLNKVTIAIGLISTVASIISSGMIRKQGWTWTALLTPLILLITSSGFFLFFFFGKQLSALTTSLGTSSVAITVIFGAAQSVLSRAAKYTVFDTTKELAFIPLTREMKWKGKACIDGIGSRLGKSGGSVIHQMLIITFSSIITGAPLAALIVFLSIGCWAIATIKVGKEFNSLTRN